MVSAIEEEEKNLIPSREINFQNIVLKLYQQQQQEDDNNNDNKFTFSSFTNSIEIELSKFTGKITLTQQMPPPAPPELDTSEQEAKTPSATTSSDRKKVSVTFPPSPERNEYFFNNTENYDEHEIDFNDDSSVDNTNDMNINGNEEEESYLSSLLDEEDDPSVNLETLEQSLNLDDDTNKSKQEEKFNEDEILAQSEKGGSARDEHISQLHQQPQQQRQQEDEHPKERTLLHDLCSGLPTQTELQECLLMDPSACSKVDPEHGQLPLHILSENMPLLKTLEGQHIISEIALQMIRIHPQAIITLDSNGRLPFILLLQDWVEETYKKKKTKINVFQEILWKTRVSRAAKGMFSPPASTMNTNATVSMKDPSTVTGASGTTVETDATGATSNRSSLLGGSFPFSPSSFYNSTSTPRQQRLSLFALRQQMSKASSVQSGDGDGADSAASTPVGGDYSDGGSIHSNPSNRSSKHRLSSKFGHILMKKNQFTASNATTTSSILDSKEWNEKSIRKFPKAYLSETAEFAFQMLSSELDFWGATSGRHLTYEQQRTNRRALGAEVAKIPQLLKTILMIEDDETRKKVLKYSIIRRTFLRKESIQDSTWLLNMLQKKGLPSKRAVDFFEEASSVTLEDYVGHFRTPLQDDRDAYRLERSEFATGVSKLTEIVPILFVLEASEIERAAATPLVWHVLEVVLSRPFVIGIVGIDLVLHVTLMITFRNSVTPTKDDSAFSSIPTQVVTQITIYFLVRKIAEAVSLLQISRRVFTSYLADIWNLFDVLAILLTVIANSYASTNPDDQRPNLNAFILALLWFKVLSFLKAINVQMATFILSVMRIIFDIRFFAIVLAVIIMMFGDLLHIVFTTTDDGKFCNPENGEDIEANVVDFCSSSPGSNYLRMYALLIGDFELEQYQQNGAITTIFVLFTIFGVIILLNVLIAVVSDSYERSTLSSRLLFGRARVSFLAEHIALEQFLEPGSNPFSKMLTSSSNMRITNKCLLMIGLIGRWVAILMLIITAILADVYLVGRAIEVALARNTSFVVMIFLVCLALFLTSSLWIIIHFIVDGFSEHLTNKHVCLKKFADRNRYVANMLLRFIRHHLFTADDTGAGNDGETVWRGRLSYLETKMGALVEQSEKQILLAIKSNESLLKDEAILVEALRSELAALQASREQSSTR